MTDLGPILALWHELEEAGTDYVLATIVAVEGSSYRRPGARMLLSQDGRRAGTVSGGCLEAEVARRAWWLTASGPVVERYSTAEDDGDRPYGSGCGGVVYLLLERPTTAAPLLAALERAFKARAALASATILDGARAGERAIVGPTENTDSTGKAIELHSLAARAMATNASFEEKTLLDGIRIRVWVDYEPARPGLWIFSAGDDAKPLVQIAQQLGWFVAIADGRSNLATRERFPSPDLVQILPIADLPGASAKYMDLRPTDAAVVMTHSFEQDSHVLASLLGLDFRLAYLGVLGPQRRTRELIAEAMRMLGRSDTQDAVDLELAQMHAPTGLDLGAATPATIALSILAEIQKALTAASGQPLQVVRGPKEMPAHCG